MPPEEDLATATGNMLRQFGTRLWQLLSTVIDTLAIHLATVYLFTDGVCHAESWVCLFFA